MFFFIGYSFNFFSVFLHHQGIPLPGRGKVGKNRSARSKTTVRSKRVGPLKSGGAPLLGSHSDIFHWFLSFALLSWHIKVEENDV